MEPALHGVERSVRMNASECDAATITQARA
ncbi:hypothetical protein M218_20580 [Burkholderia pseudomallei MSHR338]|nr:hypothetical protein M218_20580 [Burkholderia pseudomallei MSHR338]